MLNVISLGAGVQSSTMALMAAHGEIEPMPDCAIFADTGAEPQEVYNWLDWLETILHNRFPVYRVSKGDIREDTYKALNGELHGKGRAATAPFFAVGQDGAAAPLRRQCTSQYKVEPVNTKIRRLLGAEKGERLPKDAKAIVWIGISKDEIYRVKPSQEWFIERRHPLIDLGMRRGHCLDWMRDKDYPQPPRSACTFCPYHSDAEWMRLRDHDPDGWQDAVEVDAALRAGFKNGDGKQMTNALYLHRSLKPLGQVSFKHDGQADLFNNECEGMCGV